MKYRLNPSEAGVHVELYLPKKAQYQGILYTTLTEGFDPAAVRRHFRSERTGVESFLRAARSDWGLDAAGPTTICA